MISNSSKVKLWYPWYWICSEDLLSVVEDDSAFVRYHGNCRWWLEFHEESTPYLRFQNPRKEWELWKTQCCGIRNRLSRQLSGIIWLHANYADYAGCQKCSNLRSCVTQHVFVDMVWGFFYFWLERPLCPHHALTEMQELNFSLIHPSVPLTRSKFLDSTSSPISMDTATDHTLNWNLRATIEGRITSFVGVFFGFYTAFQRGLLDVVLSILC